MDISTVAGFTVGFGLVFMAIFSKAGSQTFIDIGSMLITIGGTIGAALINYSIPHITGLGKLFSQTMKKNEVEMVDIITMMVSFAEKARREGLLALEYDVEQIEDRFIRNGMQLVIDGTDPELVRDIMETELSYLKERHKSNHAFVKALGAYAPAFGMIGTLIGLIQMLVNLNDPSKIGAGMAVALVTTFYGAIMANLIFLPLAGKLEIKSQEEFLIKEIVIEGVLSIQAGENPRVVREKLKAYLPPSLRGSFEEEGGE